MRLSEAIMLGSSTCRMLAADINSCAYGCALNALGVSKSEGNDLPRYLEVIRLWPWTRHSEADEMIGIGYNPLSHLASTVYSMFDTRVCNRALTLEQLADYVRSIEPDCDCNRFNCDCAKPAVEVPEMEYVTRT